ncbi:Glucose dehydrogenase [FAD, quinone] [Folsomia candida]|uniref:Glucose dehydrogenase [FAD, quinone] n=1 Tax=Folsomia candida TaxID=158441 RepID=A0A226EA38_FOLCA|nr:Glucose dehydrogenase [FAD, quinone] [Folsomia candida]
MVLLTDMQLKILFLCAFIVTICYISSHIGQYGETRLCRSFWIEDATPHTIRQWSENCNITEEMLRLQAFLQRSQVKMESQFDTSFIHDPENEVGMENMLSTLLADQIEAIQRKGCEQPNFTCGHQNDCGLGCQLHHRIACLLISYVTKMPLIHTVDRDDWAYSNKWSEVFLPLGSNCTPSTNTFTWRWDRRKKYEVSKCHNVLFDHFHTEIPYPLSFGIPVDPSLYGLFQNITSRIQDPFLWMMGQFTKNAMKLNHTFENQIKQWKKEIGFDTETGTIVGMQIRRTDKINEAPESVHEVAEYMAQAEEYFQKIESNNAFEQPSIPRIVYISSDNTSAIDKARSLYPNWKVLGFHSSFSESIDNRKFGLFEIARDILLLAECEYVVCGLSSNLCRLIYEMQTYKKFHKNPPHLKSLDGEYSYQLLGDHSIARKFRTLWEIGDDEALSFLLLEAGGDPTFLHDIPLLTTYNLQHPETNWIFNSVRSKHFCLSCVNNSVTIPRGKLLGGSSSLNLMIYVRGNHNDFDNWASMMDDVGWSYENVLPYFTKSEDYEGIEHATKFHGTSGPLTVAAQTYHPTLKEWLAAGKEMGYHNSDPNINQTSTFYPADVNVKNGQRWSTYHAFIRPILTRQNLKIIRYAHVNFDSTRKAVGVTYFWNGRTYTASARKEVILSAGAIGSPQILMLSGIGRSKHLKSLGITRLISDLAVGDNLQDHVMSYAGPFIFNESVSFMVDRDLGVGAALEYFLLKTGPFSFNNGAGMGLFSTSDPLRVDWPNIGAFHVPCGVYNAYADDHDALFSIKKGTMAKYMEGFVGRDANFVGFNLARPRSTGTVRLATKNPFDKPVIDLNYYEHHDDIREMVKGLKTIVKLYEETDSFKKFNASLIPNHFPGCENFTLRTDEYYECFVRHFTVTSWHQCCTAKMGRQNDPTAVLDSRLRVRGVHGLRVVDASVMPKITNANLNAPVIMIGEKAADMILEDWKLIN